MTAWHTFFDEDAYSRGFIILQRGDDEATREVFDTISSEQVEDAAFSPHLSHMMSKAMDEAARRNADEERVTILTSLNQSSAKAS